MEETHGPDDVTRSLVALLIALTAAAMLAGALVASLVWWLVT